MPTFHVTRSMTAPAAAAWARISNVLAWPDWLPTVSAVRALDTTALAAGSRYVISQPKLRPATWRVTTLEDDQRFVWESTSPGLHLWASHTVRELSAHRCEIDLAFRFSGLLAPVVWPFVGGLTRRYVRVKADTLKEVVENRAASMA